MKTIQTELARVLSKAPEKSALCYRNEADVEIKNNNLFVQGDFVCKWNKNWFFDKNLDDWTPSKHVEAYRDAHVYVVDAQNIWNIDTKIMSFSRSAWCALEIMLAKEVTIVQYGQTVENAKESLMRINTLCYELNDVLNYYMQTQKKSKDEEVLLLRVYSIMMRTNNQLRSDAVRMVEALINKKLDYDYYKMNK